MTQAKMRSSLSGDFVSMVMVPMQPDGTVPLYGCVAVPVGRFERWPCTEGGDPIITPAAPGKDVKKNVLQRVFSESSSVFRVRWTVDAKKLKSKDTEAVSPQFNLGDHNFKMKITPRMTGEV